jgi:hypothetical protein
MLVDRAQLRQLLSLPAEPPEGDQYTPAIDAVAGSAEAVLVGILDADVDHSQHPACCEAALHIAVDIWQARSSAGGQPVALDFQPGSYRLSRYLVSTVSALIAPCHNVGAVIG